MSNHLSLFLCVADYDKLLPGWSHFAQFTIAVVNKDPKKSKYSDTLHRFCKKEHDWGWKKFMELTKVLDGFTVADTPRDQGASASDSRKGCETVQMFRSTVQTRTRARLSHKRRGASLRLRLIDRARARLTRAESIIVLMITTSSISRSEQYILMNIYTPIESER